MADYEQLGKYRILDELGKGGFATVYRAMDTTLDREVALKVLDPLLMRDGKWVEHFRREAKTVAALKHPHIIGIHEISEVEGRLYIAMELARGGSLAQAIETRGRFSWSETLALLQPVCEALDYAHNQGVVHRDLKPANILLDPAAGPLLTDFGFARLLVDNSMSMSLSGGVLGTPAYIAPEIWELDQAEIPADIYALGCIAYEILVGDMLFGGKTPMQVMRAHDKGPQFPETWLEDVPDIIQAVLGKALAREPEKRYPAAGAFWYALNDLEAQAESARETAERAAVAAQWRVEAEAALAAGELSAAKMAVGRWLAVMPEDKEAQAVLARIDMHLRSATEVRSSDFSRAPVAPSRRSGFSRFPVWVWWGMIVVVALGLAVGLGALLSSRLPSLPPTPTTTPTPTPTLGPGATQVRDVDGMTMVYVPAGEFEMGSTDEQMDYALALCSEYYGDCEREWFEGEQPVHTVTLDTFWIDHTEVTNGQYERCVDVGDCEPPAGSNSYTRDSYYGNNAYDDYPVLYVSCRQAADYCAWAGARLPTEAEWEYAARGPQEFIYPWGDKFDGTRLNYCDANCEFDWADKTVDDGYADTAPVGSYPGGASWCGALDLAGNVWEWTADWYGDYPVGRQVNPSGPSSGEYQVLCGGSWYDYPSVARGAIRGRYVPDVAWDYVGFRCARGSQ